MIESSDPTSGVAQAPATGTCGTGCSCNAAAEPTGPRREHWRSLEQRAGTPEAREFMEREFPVGASELPEGIDRRTLVQLLGASLALAGAAGCRRPVENIVPYVNAPEDTVPGVPKHYATTLPFGTDGYGLLVESHEGRPTKIEGNELHPATVGGASAQMQASILGLYDPDRSQHVAAGKEKEKKTWADFVAAWKVLEAEHLADGGAGLAVLSPPSSSPTLFRLAGLFRERFPQARWTAWEPVNDENALAGAAWFAGRPLKTSFDVGAAKVIFSLDADLLLGESGAVANARGFAAGRRLASEKDTMNRLWVVESAHTTTGGMADHRLALPSGQIGPLALALGQALAASGVALALPAAGGAIPGVPPRWIETLAKDLAANPGAGLVVAGRHQPPAVHAAALAINAALGNLGTTVFLREPQDVLAPSAEELAALVSGMNGGQVSTLVILSGNPCYDAPVDLGFEKALAKVKNVLHLGLLPDETAAIASKASNAGWHLPEAHFLEAWGDCRAADGTASVVQPLIEPLYGGRSAIEIAALLATGEEKPGLDLVKETWRTILPAAPADASDPDLVFDTAFNKVLHDGLLVGSALPTVAPEASAIPADAVGGLALAGASGLELSFRPSPAVHDGRFANVGWLQELPDAVTKMTWGNAALLAPKTAERLKLGNEDGAKLTLGGASVELPVWIVPGQAEETVVVHLGYGRRISGRIGTGVGADVYPLRSRAALGFASGAKIEPSGKTHKIAQTQDHGTMEGRPIVREATLEEWRHEPEFAAEMVEIPKSDPLWTQHKYDTGPQWGMAIDLSACTGCNACVIACQSENNVPIVGHEQVRRGREMHWLRIDRYFSGSPEQPEMVFQPMPCQQCENAPCEQVCPVAATVHTADGLNSMVYNRCIGTRYCSNNCPYKVRRFNFFNYTKDTPELLKLAANPDVTVRSRGVMEKCTFCVQRIQRGKIDAKMAERPLKDGDVRTACQQTCPSQAIVFGDIHDPETRVTGQKRNRRNYVLLAELGNKPRTSYLARIRNPHPDLAESARHAEKAEA